MMLTALGRIETSLLGTSSEWTHGKGEDGQKVKCASGGRMDQTWIPTKQPPLSPCLTAKRDNRHRRSMFGECILSPPTRPRRDAGMRSDGTAREDPPKGTVQRLRPLSKHPELEVICTKVGETWVNEYRVANFRTLESGRTVDGHGSWGLTDLVLLGVALWLAYSRKWDGYLAIIASGTWADLFEVRCRGAGSCRARADCASLRRRASFWHCCS